MKDPIPELKRQLCESATALVEAEKDGLVNLGARAAFEKQVELALDEAMKHGVKLTQWQLGR